MNEGDHSRIPKRDVRSSPSEFAWRGHSAQEHWTAKADAKASIVLALLTFVLALGAAAWLGTENRAGLAAADSPWRFWVGALGIACVVAGIVVAASAIWPRLATSRDSSGLIYFGHLKSSKGQFVDKSALVARKISDLTEEAETQMLANQLVAMANTNWQKHRLLQLSVVLGMVGLIALTTATLWP